MCIRDRDNALRGAITLEDVEAAIPLCVKRKLVSVNEKAIKVVQQVARV